ncbi:hypothetical protein CAEBREN_09841 [Caenorhabditis brenneri]|uniref:RRM domain-containing protein n=1 Tax=Caenorhabditis brenneri TaxID=135651 RepID=G0N3M8_CAEBE|nr:hypothetical protein CAEBREN_09841 [Caenorhabditis brenneri]
MSNNALNCTKIENEIEEERLVLQDMQKKMAEELNKSERASPPSTEEQKEIDARSVFVGNVDFGSTIEELEAHFKGCGTITRTTIPKDKYTQRQKNFAYIEFEDKDSVEMALVMHETMFRDRRIVVTAKRTNVPGMGAGRGRGRGFGGRGGGRGGVVVKYVYVNGPAPAAGRGGARGGARGRGRFAPY